MQVPLRLVDEVHVAAEQGLDVQTAFEKLGQARHAFLVVELLRIDLLQQLERSGAKEVVDLVLLLLRR
jgi:hypothetical protein